jgi:hypothetical protein
MKAYARSGCIDTHFLDLSTSWKWVVSFTPQPLNPWGKRPWYPLDRRLGGPQSWSGWHGENSWPYWDTNSDPSVIQPIASHYTNSMYMVTFSKCQLANLLTSFLSLTIQIIWVTCQVGLMCRQRTIEKPQLWSMLFFKNTVEFSS